MQVVTYGFVRYFQWIKVSRFGRWRGFEEKELRRRLETRSCCNGSSKSSRSSGEDASEMNGND